MTSANITTDNLLNNSVQLPQAGFVGIITKLKIAQRRRMVFRRTIGELGMLSNRDLNDIGIRRSDIRRLAQEEAMKVTT